MTREVHELFVERWVDRYIDVWTKHGERAARGWVRDFLNDSDKPKFWAAVEARRSAKK